MKSLLLLAPLALAACGGSGPCDAPPDVSGLDFASAREKLKHLSQLCVVDPPLVKGSGKMVMKSGTVPYEMTTPLFTDYAHKLRTIWIPAGKQINYSESDLLDFPVGTIITKTFSFPADERQPEQNVTLVETRVLMRTATGWLTLPYVWNADQTEASIDIVGSLVRPTYTDKSGAARTINHLIPSANQCLLCHEGTTPQQPIGTKARFLNRTNTYEGQTVNQLDYLVSKGWLAGAPAASARELAPPYDDPNSGSLEQRARGWLDINCAHCHSITGGARTTGFFPTFGETDPFKLGLCKPPVAAGSATGGRLYDIVPGKPDESILTFRLESTEPSMMMPPVGRSLVHAESVAVLKEWIAAMPGSCN